jgi:hypothetical protein
LFILCGLYIQTSATMYYPLGSCAAEACDVFRVGGIAYRTYIPWHLQYTVSPGVKYGTAVHYIPWCKIWYCSTLYPLTWNISHTSARQDPVGSYIVAVVYIPNPDNIKNYKFVPEEADYYMVFLLQQCGLTLVNSRNLEL